MSRKRETDDRNGEGRFAYEGLDRVLHEKARLGILTSLVAHPEGLKFSELRGLCSLTDGNLSLHLRRLEEVGYVLCEKTSNGRSSRTSHQLTSAGRRALGRYLDNLEHMIHAVRTSLNADL